MLAEWSAECSADDPVLVVPWATTPGGPRFIDLRENPYDLDQVAEAELHPPLMQALRALNANRSPVFTAKCDAWPMDADELASTQLNLDLSAVEAPSGFSSYLDLLWRDRPLFISLAQQQQRLQRLARLVEPLDHPYAVLECVLRPALIDLPAPAASGVQRAQEGFAITLYVKALGTDAPHAYEHWTQALSSVVLVLRSKDFTSA